MPTIVNTLTSPTPTPGSQSTMKKISFREPRRKHPISSFSWILTAGLVAISSLSLIIITSAAEYMYRSFSVSRTISGDTNFDGKIDGFDVIAILRHVAYGTPVRNGDIVAPHTKTDLADAIFIMENLLSGTYSISYPQARKNFIERLALSLVAHAGAPEPECDNGVDDDGDGFVDGEDSGCLKTFDNDESS